jgi:intein-encoded DNA endonuclease-like protein
MEKKMNNDVLQKCISLYQEEKSLRYISKIVGINHSYIGRKLKDNEIQMRKNGYKYLRINNLDYNRILKMRKEGKSLREIGDALHCSYMTIRNRLIENGDY